MRGAFARGREFEVEVAQLLRDAGFEVTADAKSAKPRQTDLFAKGDKFDLLVEAKNQKRKVTIDDVDALRSRLGRTSPDIVGVIFTTSELTRGAIGAIEADRSREVLAFVKEEIEHLRSGRKNLRTLIDRKRNELRVQGRAWFGPEIHSEYIRVKLPPRAVELQLASKSKPYFESKSSIGGGYYSLQIPDSGWGSMGGEGARLSIQLALSNFEDLRNIVGYLHKKFGLSSNGMFWIQQSSSCWHGVGVENFLYAVKQWRKRYAQSKAKTFHHSEEFGYFDQFRNGWLELSSQQRIDMRSSDGIFPSFMHQSQLVIQLPGVPVDTSRFLDLCQYTGNDWANFEYIRHRLTSGVTLKKALALNVVGTVINREPISVGNSDAHGVVIGLISRNPFYGKRTLPKELLRADLPPLNQLNETELLVCALRDWHDDGDMVDSYTLQGFEVTVGGLGTIIRPFGTWNHILKRARNQ